MATTGEVIQYYLFNLGMSQSELADKCGVSRKTVWKWVNNENSPKLPYAYKIADALNISLDELAGLEPALDEDTRLDDIIRMYEGMNDAGRDYVHKAVTGASMMPEFKG